MIDRKSRTLARCIAVAVLALGIGATLGAQTPATPTAQTPPATSVPAPEWKAYSYPADGFSATFSSTPEQQKKDVPTAAGSFELRAYLTQDGEAATFVGVCDYGTAVAGRDPDSVLDGAQQGAISNVSAHLISGSRITLGIYHGVQFEAESDTMHFSARVYLVGTTLYQTLVASPLGKPYAGTTRFLDSFQLIARVKN